MQQSFLEAAPFGQQELKEVPSRRIASLEVIDLFGSLHHLVPFNVDSRISLIHGPNGVGKTTILRLVASLFRGNYSALRRIPFGSAVLTFVDGSVLRVHRVSGPKQRLRDGPGQVWDLKFAFTSDGGRSQEATISPLTREERRYFPLGMIETRIDSLERVSEVEWLDRSTGETIGLEQVVERYGDHLPMPRELLLRRAPKWLDTVRLGIPILLIETQRLWAISETYARARRRGLMPPGPAISRFSSELASTIQIELAQSATISQRLDRTFPSRLLKRKLPKSATEEVIRNRYKTQGDLRHRLMNAGLLDTATELALPRRSLDATERRVLWMYLRDVDQKLRGFGEVLDRIELFKDVVNSKFVGKSLEVDKAQGFVFQALDGTFLDATELSSGEQHEVILAYQLLFQVASGSLILIDEPELSLHVTWQHRFLDDLRRISTTADLDFLLATHSPQIVHKHWDWAVELEY